MEEFRLSRSKGRVRTELLAYHLGSDLIVCLYNESAHLGAVAVADYDHKEQRASTSVITRLGHKDDEIARRQAHLIARRTEKPVCVICGVHLDNITKPEIDEFLAQSDSLVEELLDQLGTVSPEG